MLIPLSYQLTEHIDGPLGVNLQASCEADQEPVLRLGGAYPNVPLAFCIPINALPEFQLLHVGLSSIYISITFVVSYITICCVVEIVLHKKCGTLL